MVHANKNEKAPPLKIGTALAGAGRVLISAQNNQQVIPWDEIENGKYFIKVEAINVENGSTLAMGQSKHFLVSKNSTLICDVFSIASGFAKEAAGELRTWRNYRTCGLDFQTVYSYRLGDQAALAVANNATKRIIFSFRGTVMALSDWMHDLSVAQIACDTGGDGENRLIFGGCGGGFVHSGFAWAYNFTRDPFRALAREYLQLGYEVILTGHSKGGAIANLQALDLIQLFGSNGGNIRLVTFGAPRVGDQKFASVLDAVLNPKPTPCFHARFVTVSKYCGADPVTGLPPRGYYDHAGHEVHVDCSLSCTKRDVANQVSPKPMGVAAGCHFMTKYIEAVSVNLQGHTSQCT